MPRHVYVAHTHHHLPCGLTSGRQPMPSSQQRALILPPIAKFHKLLRWINRKFYLYTATESIFWTMGVNVERVAAKLKELAFEVAEEEHGEITYSGAGELAFNFNVTIRNFLVEFRWTLHECLFTVWRISERGEDRTEQYENGQLEDCNSVRSRLDNMNQRYRRRLRREGLENYYSRGFY